MLVSLKEILKFAEAKKCGIGAFNTPNLTSLKAVLLAAEEQREPVIIMHAQVHEEMGLCKMDEMAPIMLFMADKTKVPVCVHLDHGTDMDYVKRGLDLGFTSVMYDGSELPEEENFANTCMMSQVIKRYGASLEGEIGSMGSRESGGDGGESIYTDPELAKRFVEETGVDALACAFGTAHGLYAKEPKLDFDRLKKIRELTNIPIVMHGGSGISDENFKESIKFGVRKINYYSYMAKAGAEDIESLSAMKFFHEIETAAISAMKKNVAHAIDIFSMG